MNSFAKHLIEYSEGSLTYKGTNYFNTTGSQIIPGPNFDYSGFNSSKFANDMIAHLTQKNVDFAGYVSNNGAGIESVISDPILDTQSIIGGALSAGIIPLLGIGINEYRSGNKKRGLLLSLSGAGLAVPFAINMINSGINYYSSNLVTSLLGLKGLLYNGGMFMMGLGGYSILSAINDYRKDKNSKGKAIAKGIFGGLETAAGLTFTLASFSTMTSLAYEGAGLFSISTAGLAGILSTTIPLGIGLATAGLIAGITYLYKYLNKWYKDRKASKQANNNSATANAPAQVNPDNNSTSTYGGDPDLDPFNTNVNNDDDSTWEWVTGPSSNPADSSTTSPPPGSLAAEAAARLAARNTVKTPATPSKPPGLKAPATPPPVPAAPAVPKPSGPPTPPGLKAPAMLPKPAPVPAAPAAPKPSGPPIPPRLIKPAPAVPLKPVSIPAATSIPKPASPTPITMGSGAPNIKPLPKPVAKPVAQPVQPKPAASVVKPAAQPVQPKPAAPVTPPVKPTPPSLPVKGDDSGPWDSTPKPAAQPVTQPASNPDDDEEEDEGPKLDLKIVVHPSAKDIMDKFLKEKKNKTT